MLSSSDVETKLTPGDVAALQMSSTELARAIDNFTIAQARGFDRALEEEIRRLERVKLAVVAVRQAISKGLRQGD